MNQNQITPVWQSDVIFMANTLSLESINFEIIYDSMSLTPHSNAITQGAI
jgi:hypothetical protein